jgi:hypothetical protein
VQICHKKSKIIIEKSVFKKNAKNLSLKIFGRTLKFPQCLFFLDSLLQQNGGGEFREALANPSNARFIEDQQVLQWQFYIRKRARFLEQADQQQQVGGGGFFIIFIFL